MIYGIGTDIVRVARLQRSLERWGERFAERILCDSELREYRRYIKKAHFLAKRFAAKEAAAKAMGIGFQNGLQLKHIQVSHDEYGKPMLNFDGAAEAWVQQKSIVGAHLSISDEEDHAIAFVILET